MLKLKHSTKFDGKLSSVGFLTLTQMKITTKTAKKILTKFSQDVIESDKLETFIFPQVMFTGRVAPLRNSMMGQLYSEILEIHQKALDRIDGFSDFWRWALIRRLVDPGTSRDEESHVGRILNDLIGDFGKPIEITTIVYFPFSIPPPDPIKITDRFMIRGINRRESEVLNSINKDIEVRNKSRKGGGPLMTSEGTFAPESITIYEFKVGNYDFDKIMELVHDRFMSDLHMKLDQFTYIPDNPILTENILMMNALRNYNIVINQAPLRILREEILIDSIWLNEFMQKQFRFSFSMFDGMLNFQSEENLKILVPNLRILFKLLFDNQVNQIRVLMNRFSMIMDTYRSTIDKIVDGMILFEAICSPGIFTNKSQNVAFRSALLLEDEEDKRYEVYEFIRSLYRRRNEVVHGSNPKTTLSHEEFEKFFKYAKTLFMRALTIYNVNNYEEEKPNWQRIMSKLDFAGFDTTKPFEEILGMRK